MDSDIIVEFKEKYPNIDFQNKNNFLNSHSRDFFTIFNMIFLCGSDEDLLVEFIYIYMIKNKKPKNFEDQIINNIFGFLFHYMYGVPEYHKKMFSSWKKD